MPRNFSPAAVATKDRNPERAMPKKTGVVVFSKVPVAKRDVRLYRNWADNNEWIRAAINHRKTQISGAPWDVTPILSDKRYSDETRLALIGLFAHPNTKTDSFRLLVEPVVEDILTLDAGSIEQVRNFKGFPVQLWVVNGADIRVDPAWDGDPNEFRYYWYPMGRWAASLLDRDLLYIMANPSSHRVVGISPLETLRETVDAEIASMRFNKAQVLQMPPQGIVDLGEDATPDNVDQFERYWTAEIAGYKSTAIVGGTKNLKFVPFGQSNKDMQFLQWQSYLIRKIAAVFQISPQDLGILFDVNRANAQVQAELSEDRGLRPLISLIESHFNREVVGEYARVKAKHLHYRGEIDMETLRMAVAMSYLDGRERPGLFAAHEAANVLNLQFHFRIPSGRSARARADIHKIALGGVPYATINEEREEELKDPVEGGDEIIVPTPLGPIRLHAITGQVQASPIEQAFLDYALRNDPIIVSTPPVPLTSPGK